MSVIIRLQNLPLSAKSGDVRSFFEGLHIPNGGVHILGGEKGDAFIAFTSSEDARLAMKKDGEKIKDSRIRLFSSNHLEMKYEVEKLTKCSFVDTSSYKLCSSPERILEDEVNRHKITEKTDRRRYSRSRSPIKYSDRDDDRFRNHYHQRSKSPGRDTFDSQELLLSKYRSSARKRSDSPHRSRSPKSRSYFERQGPSSPKVQSYLHQNSDDVFHSNWIKTGYLNNSVIEPSRQREIQAELERRITEALEMNPALLNLNAGNISESQGNASAMSDKIERALFSEDFQATLPVRNSHANFMQHDLPFSALPPMKNDALQFQDTEFRQSLDRNYQNFSSSGSREIFEPNELEKQRINYFIIMSGMDPTWDIRKVQSMMKGIYAPLHCIKWEKDDSGYKTGTAAVKLSKKDDFECMMHKATFMFDGRRITVSECPPFLIYKYFSEDSSCQSIQNIVQNCNLCYILKGLPFSCTYKDIVDFFLGFDIDDIIIMYGKDGRATGTGFVSFNNWKDFEAAKSQNGKKIGHRYIEMLPRSKNEMIEAKKWNNPPVPSLIPAEKTLSRRPLCALLTGLPFFTNAKKLSAFFSESGLKPDAIHITLNKKRTCDGRAFVEFVNFRDFDLALKLHGSKFRDNIICVKQILYDEMTKILDVQKAKHHFEVQEPDISPSDVPEKVPYLWEPPDASEEQERFSAGNTDIQLWDHTFNPTFNYKSATSKLSPPKDLNSSRSKNWDASIIEDFDVKRRSPEEKRRYPHHEKSMERERRYPRDEKHKYSSRSRSEKDSRRSNNGRLDYPHTMRSESRYSENEERLLDDKTRECTVQLSNVHEDVGTMDIVEFFQGFNFFNDSIVRRYTSEGKPTNDVRVTFPNRQEAEIAVRSLNGRFLRDMRVNIFIA